MLLLINELGVFCPPGYGRYTHLPIIRNLYNQPADAGWPHDFGNYRDLTVPTVTKDVGRPVNPFIIMCLPRLRSNCDFQDLCPAAFRRAAPASGRRPVRRRGYQLRSTTPLMHGPL